MKTTNELVFDYFSSLSSFLIEMGNMAYNLKKYNEETNPEKKKEYLVEASHAGVIAVENIATLITSPMGGKLELFGDLTVGSTTALRLHRN